MTSPLCTSKLGFGRNCGARLEDQIDQVGRISWHCPLCVRRTAGRCRLCPSRLPNDRAWYCHSCAAARAKKRNNSGVETLERRKARLAYMKARDARLKFDVECRARKLASQRRFYARLRERVG